MARTASAPLPDYRASYAIRNLALLIPSAFASALVLFTFGTTAHFRDTIYTTFVPKRWQQRRRRNEQQATRRQQQGDSQLQQQPGDLESGRAGAAAGDHAAAAAERGEFVLGRRFADRGSWVAGLRRSTGSGIPLRVLDEEEQLREGEGGGQRLSESGRTAARSSGIGSIPELRIVASI